MSLKLRQPKKPAGTPRGPIAVTPADSAPHALAIKAPASQTAVFVPDQNYNPAAQILGDAGSSEALRNLLDATEHVKRTDTLKLLRQALEQFKAGDWAGGGDTALKALHVDEKSAEAWHILAVSRDKCNDFASAITCYETALRIQPENPIIANDLGRLAYKMGLYELSEKFFQFFLDKNPGHVEAINNLASSLRELNRLDDAIDLLRNAIGENPTDAQLWNALGTVVNAQGDMANSIIFYEEALRHDPIHVHARYNLGNAKGVLGRTEEALADLKTALPLFLDPMHVHTCRLSIAFCYLVMGQLEEGWKWYESRGKDETSEKIHYLIPKPHWTPDMPLAGKRIFVSAEQGLGDEILFANVMDDLLREIGPNGHLTIGVEPRLVPLFEKGFPAAKIVRHHTTKHQNLPVRLFPDITDWEAYDCWAIMGDFLSRYRKTVADFPSPHVFFKPDPTRVAYWKSVLAELNDKPKIGILWKSLIRHSRRDRYYSPFQQWDDILRLDGIQIVNLQYGDTSEELAWAAANGVNIWTPPGIDLKNDLDELSALCVALDCLLGPANATSNIAGAAGATVWMITPENSWTSLGTDHMPWYPSTRVFFSESLLDWSPVMGRVKAALIETFTK
ncbi:tetratricopeptide repeat protein [Asticcacaulis sp. 201]|uniref:tetratricopeptide repeat protein n=1 Tax=Asticcacaulis sp. 201 TaxID=3028787 RepID=UPI002916B13F|nr:tetratricopeptide repeat protein [Asticcacaulis sp. 201]MDV6329570.1 tetratricopeptide repeat protein [Asticcacaulis sp. 201]